MKGSVCALYGLSYDRGDDKFFGFLKTVHMGQEKRVLCHESVGEGRTRDQDLRLTWRGLVWYKDWESVLLCLINIKHTAYLGTFIQFCNVFFCLGVPSDDGIFEF